MASHQEESGNTQSVASNWGDSAEQLRQARLEQLKALGDSQEADDGMISRARQFTSVGRFNAESIRPLHRCPCFNNGII